MGKVVVGSESTAKKVITQLNAGKPVVMLYHMNGCGHCQVLMGEDGESGVWNQCVKKYSGDGMIAQVEMSSTRFLPSFMQNVRGFPTIVMYRVGALPMEYLGDRSEPSISQFITRYLATPKSSPPKAKPKKPKARKPHTI